MSLYMPIYIYMLMYFLVFPYMLMYCLLDSVVTMALSGVDLGRPSD